MGLGQRLPRRGSGRRAFTGHAANLDLVNRIKDAVNIVVQFGGGLRDPDRRALCTKALDA